MPEIIPRHLMIALVFFTFAILGGIALITAFVPQDVTSADPTFRAFQASFNKSAEIQDNLDAYRSSLTSPEGAQQSTLSSILTTVSWFSITDFFNKFGLIFTIATSSVTIFGLPMWAVSTLCMLVVIIISFAIISAVFFKDV